MKQHVNIANKQHLEVNIEIDVAYISGQSGNEEGRVEQRAAHRQITSMPS